MILLSLAFSTQAPYRQAPDTGSPQMEQAHVVPQEEKICGMSKKTFAFTVTLSGIILTAILVGTGAFSKSDLGDPTEPPKIPPPPKLPTYYTPAPWLIPDKK